jgi:hypothetical protein
MRGFPALGVAFLVIFAVIVLLGARGERDDSRRAEAGQPMPPFAAPLALGELEGDANVATEAESGDAGQRPACEVRGEGILNVCELYERAPVAVAIFATPSEQCEDQVDALESADTEGIEVAAVAVTPDRDQVRELVRARGWELPVGWDSDGAVASRYGVFCGTVFAEQGGDITEIRAGQLSEADLDARLDELR